MDLFTICLTNYFFAITHARRTVKYHSNLLKLSNLPPEVYREFQNHLVGIETTKKSFSRQPIDITLGQTIYGDASNHRTGISWVTNSIGARQRWVKSHFIKVAVVSQVFDELGLAKKEDLIMDLKKHSIKKLQAKLRKVMKMIKDTMNLFNSDIDLNFLRNIGTENAASDSTATFVLDMVTAGET